jgi:hypothetical protein
MHLFETVPFIGGRKYVFFLIIIAKYVLSNTGINF